MPADFSPPAYRDLYLMWREAEGLREVTLRGYRDAIQIFLQTPGLPDDVREIRPDHAIAFLAMLRRRGMTEGGMSVYQRAAWTWLRWLHTQGHLPVNIPTLVKPVRVRDVERLVTDEEAKRRMMVVIRDQREMAARDAAILETLWGTGVRRTECVWIQLENTDIEQGQIYLEGAHTKSGVPRIVALGRDARLAILNYIVTKRGREPGPLFLSRRGERMTPDSVTKLYQRVRKLAGVRATPHAFRRAFAAGVRRDGMDIASVMTLMGHTDPKMTLIYSETGEAERAIADFHELDKRRRQRLRAVE